MNSQELRALQEAYSQVYELDEAGKNDARIRGNIKSFGSNYTPPRDWDQSANRGQGAVLNAKQKEKQRRKGLAKGAMGEEVDLYDIILSHLLDEGYAETPEQAEAIMVNMSEDWRESIVEGVFDFLPKQTTAIPGKYGKNSVLSKKDGVEGVSDKSKPGSFTPRKGGFDRMDAERYGAEQIKKGSNAGDINLAGRRETPGRVK